MVRTWERKHVKQTKFITIKLLRKYFHNSEHHILTNLTLKSSDTCLTYSWPHEPISPSEPNNLYFKLS